MENLDVNALWKEYDQKLQESRAINLQAWVVNRQTFEWLQTQKARSRLKPMGTFKGRAVFLGIVWALFLAGLMAINHWQNPYFTVSIGAILAFTIYAIVVYLWQRSLIRQIDYTDSVLETQEKLAALQASTLRTTRIGFLQTPFYSTFFWGNYLVGTTAFWAISVPIALGLTFAALWLYRNISLANADKKWFRILFNNIEWTPIIRAMEYLKEIEEFKTR
jgi:hypothetical protein